VTGETLLERALVLLERSSEQEVNWLPEPAFRHTWTRLLHRRATVKVPRRVSVVLASYHQEALHPAGLTDRFTILRHRHLR
jgi:hypothetical protein